MSNTTMKAPDGRTGRVQSSFTGLNYDIDARGVVSVDTRDVGTMLNAGFSMYDDSTANVAAAGTTQGTATALTAETNTVSAADGTKGVVLPAAAANKVVTVINSGNALLKVYPASGGAINALSANAAFSVGPGETATFAGDSATQWYTGSAGGQTGIQGVAAGYAIARGVATITGSGTVVTGLGIVAAVTATMQADASLANGITATATIGDQAGAPAAGSVILKVWKPTASGDVTPIASGAAVAVNWIAVGTPA